jgi:ABC-type multidrug transport system fused ATPase/permease subunit
MKVSMDRIRDFLKETELEKYGQSEPIFQQPDSSIGFRDGKFIYHGTQLRDDSLQSNPDDGFSLKNIDLDFPAGQMTVICGSTGSGKTSLILSLLGELQRIYNLN